MKKLAIGLILLLTHFSGLIAESKNLSSEATVHIMTLGPYQKEIYSVFGHSAIRIVDPKSNLDVVYNYGVFDFDQENFFWNFARGKMLYQLGKSRYERFKNFYISENRKITEQVVQLDSIQVNQVYQFLENNYLPENREYYYNYVYDNCATKIPDVFEEVFKDRLYYDTAYITEPITIRSWMDKYLTQQPWGDWIIDAGLGMQIDKKADFKTILFLPDQVQQAFDHTGIIQGSDTLAFVKESIEVYNPTAEETKVSIWTPFTVFTVLFFIIGWVTNRNMKTGSKSYWLDRVLFFVLGFFGVWLVFLWFFTDHLSKWNLNLLWAIPTHLLVVFLIGKPKFNQIIKYYLWIVVILQTMLIVGWSLWPQPLHIGIIPLSVAVILRSLFHLRGSGKLI